ncbi:MAG: response regulator transcription factor [Bacteroidetes bacterium]|nr:response regulator transcription factor [Bacteroidota bacterium]
MNEIQIAIVDDHALFRDGIRMVLNQIDGFNVIYDTSDGRDFIDFIKKSPVDIVLMDIEMPDLSGIETTIQALEIIPDLKIIALTMFTDEMHCIQMMKTGVKGYILKKSNKFQLQQAIEEVFNGGNYFSQEIVQKLASRAISKKKYDPDQLSDREKDVLELICKGRTSKEIADQLFLSIKTVEVHRTNILRKACVRNSTELFIWAVKNNLVAIE